MFILIKTNKQKAGSVYSVVLTDDFFLWLQHTTSAGREKFQAKCMEWGVVWK